ncbi:hypothetical protein BN6_77020 [Saccharothrix espanaensis DSM 44229]|uniref:Uncharacterized protein n=1 Tax=Saccharothrix espanaensis (strain ATCC 51144 / DSM 44229 / JCM 9112 / NBRC 15066 / NRRL 15764) TaxID=1179773 RepID=K0KEF1_SACES|nr:hypothetical protein BN6_77020 [Saccharothrix espanaensis DSM 44229]
MSGAGTGGVRREGCSGAVLATLVPAYGVADVRWPRPEVRTGGGRARGGTSAALVRLCK